MAAMRGVQVRLGVPAVNNHRSVQYASRALYAGLLEAGVRIFERRGPLLHAKAMVVDGLLAVFGSANLDVRSLRLNYESTVVAYDAMLADRLMEEMLADFAESDEIGLNVWLKRPRRQRILENAFSLADQIL
jgi:cardiolipin synthase